MRFVGLQAAETLASAAVSPVADDFGAAAVRAFLLAGDFD
jgi:hypothetical protein